ncbi:fibrinogen-like protein 1-like protein [Amblyraja radiata]|uniref:fibrinogen-like protein 1-like protein n=1 Tax=Amblyraja radiata TaxID=386614 RepID=UPI001402EE8E|nr:fibrinogen-like protein 1-like protein [Amblyraja radiata]XP_032901989.1 fibrinogen-like protein 1-like protein [Amblyraja radiata]
MEQGNYFCIHLLLLLIVVATESAKIPRDCTEIISQNRRAVTGLYAIQPTGSPLLVVNCIMKGRSGWTVIQSNSRASKIIWTVGWITYKYGFGDVLTDHWLGNEYIYLMTKQKAYKLRIEFINNRRHTLYAEYDSFQIDSESGRYTIRLGPFRGNVGDRMTKVKPNNVIDNLRFSTQDCDYDNSRRNCAARRGGWWYDNCGQSRLNTKYPYWYGINIQTVKMMILPTH